MKIQPKQIDELVRFFGTMATSSALGFIVGVTGHAPVTTVELVFLALSFASTAFVTLLLRSKP
jgi:hypothetical protein